MRMSTLASSSKGNCAFVSAGGKAILVDAGISCRNITTKLAMLDCSLNQVAAVLITHEHIDHMRGLRRFIAQSKAAICATAPVLEALINKDAIEPGALLVEVGNTPFCAGGMEIVPFATPHDSVGSVGYRIHTPDDHLVAVATDMGEVTQAVLAGVIGCEVVLLEANYDPVLLKMSNYLPHLKRRIASSMGHLPNAQSGELACRLVSSGTTRLILGHLSRENNNPSLAFVTVQDALTAQGAVQDRDYLLEVAPYDTLGSLIRF